MRTIFLSLLLMSGLLNNNYSCYCQKITVLPLQDAYKKPEPITSKEFVESFTYIPLESSPASFIDANPKINLTSEYIIVINFKKCLLFDRFSGKFLREIGHYGRDPGGYLGTSSGFYDEPTSAFYFKGWKDELFKYSLKGDKIGSVPHPAEGGLSFTLTPEQFNYLGDSLIVCNILNTNGIQDKLIMIFDEKRKVLRTIPNRNITKEQATHLSIGSLNFFHYDGKLLYSEIYSDTIFHLTSDKVVPYLIWEKGPFRASRIFHMSPPETITTRVFFESKKYVSFTFSPFDDRFFALYDKSTSKLKVCKIPLGIKNDIDGFMPFIPVAIHNEELIGLIQAIDVVGWFERNKVTKEKIPQSVEKLSAIEVTDNPVVVIAKLKM